MGTISFTDDLRAEYERLFAEAEIPADKQPVVEAAAKKILASWARYETVAASLGIPPHPIALIHAMESAGNFERHLHNGDPLTARTVHVPAGRPTTGEPPYSWECSAMDVLRLHKIDEWKDWSIAGLCYVLERYNGWGYRKYHPNVKSPYLWSFTSIYTTGKYVADGKWNESAASQQVGAMALLLEIAQQGQPYPVEVGHAQDQGLAATSLQPTAPVLPSVLPDAQGDGQQVGQTMGDTVSSLLARFLPVLKTLSTSKTMAGVVGLVVMQLTGHAPWDIRLWIGGQIYDLPNLQPYVSSAFALLATWGRITAKPTKR